MLSNKPHIGEPVRAAAARTTLSPARRAAGRHLAALPAELAERGIKVSYYAVWHFFEHEGISFKKKPVRQRAGDEGRNGKRIKDGLTRRAWSSSTRLIAKAPQGHWRTLTFLAALRHDRIEAPCVIAGPINGESFLAYVEQV